jgi:DNA end-binding protein Ku
MGSRSVWTGAISFGLVNVQVKLYTTVTDDKTGFRQTCPAHNARIQQRRFCSANGEEVAYSDMGRAVELPGGELLAITDEDLAGLPLATTKRVEVVQFVPAGQVVQFTPGAPLNPLAFEKAYYMAPDKGSEKAYALLAAAMAQEGKVAVAKFALRQKEQVAILVPFGGMLVLQLLHWPDEVKTTGEFGFLDKPAEVSDAEAAMAAGLIGIMSGDFDPAAWVNEYEAALAKVIEAKQAGKPLAAPAETAPVAQVTDLAALLAASIDATKKTGAKTGPASINDPKAKPGRAKTTRKAA